MFTSVLARTAEQQLIRETRVAGTESSRRRPPGRKRRFDRADLVQAAQEIAEESGLESVSMRGVAQRLGISMPALYHYVANRDELLGLLAVALLERVEVPDENLPWDEWLTLYVRRTRARLQQEPALARNPYVVVHGFFTPELAECGLAVLTRAGFSSIEAMVILFRFAQVAFTDVAYEHAVLLEAAHGRTQLSTLRRHVCDGGRELPLMGGVVDEVSHLPDTFVPPFEQMFEWTIAVLVTGLEDARSGRAKIPNPYDWIR